MTKKFCDIIFKVKLKTPSPKVLAFLLIVVILTTATIVSSKFFNKANQKNENSSINLTIKNNLGTELDPQDTDGDGLPDWQEEIWGTDKNNPDTDGDGTTDGEEVNQNRNPLIPGPDDKILNERDMTSQIIANSLKNSSTDPNSVTSILSKNLLLRLAQLEQAGQYSNETGDELAKNLVEQTYSEVQIPEKYPVNLFLTFNSKDKEKLEEYRNKLVDIQTTELLKLNPNSPDSVQETINTLKNIAFRFSVIGVPEELLSVHAKLTNNYYLAAEALINLKLSDKDPVLGILSIPIYKKTSEEQPILYQQVQNYLEDNGIIFSTN
jgi:hypothetical protein